MPNTKNAQRMNWALQTHLRKDLGPTNTEDNITTNTTKERKTYKYNQRETEHNRRQWASRPNARKWSQTAIFWRTHHVATQPKKTKLQHTSRQKNKNNNKIVLSIVSLRHEQIE